jgi:hypothetical protein
VEGDAPRAAGRKRGAYIELNFPHGEIQPTFWWLAQQVGVDLDFYVLRQNAEQNALAHVPGPVHLTPLDAADPHDPCAAPLGVEHRWSPYRYDFLVLGTAEPYDRVAKLLPIDLPKLLVVHNLEQLPPPTPGVTYCVLAGYLRDRLGGLPVLAVEPYYLGEAPPDTLPARPIVCVPGTVQLARRNYLALVRALARLRGEGYEPEQLTIRIVGHWSPSVATRPGARVLDGEPIRAFLAREGLDRFVEFPDRAYDYPDFYERVRTSRYVLPLIDEVYEPTRRYLLTTTSGSIAQGIAWLKIPVLNARHAELLGIDFGYRYERDDVASGLRQVLAVGDDGDELARVAAFREARLAAAAEAFASWVSA